MQSALAFWLICLCLIGSEVRGGEKAVVKAFQLSYVPVGQAEDLARAILDPELRAVRRQQLAAIATDRERNTLFVCGTSAAIERISKELAKIDIRPTRYQVSGSVLRVTPDGEPERVSGVNLRGLIGDGPPSTCSLSNQPLVPELKLAVQVEPIGPREATLLISTEAEPPANKGRLTRQRSTARRVVRYGEAIRMTIFDDRNQRFFVELTLDRLPTDE